MRSSRPLLAAGALLSCALAGCNDLERFTTAPGEVYCGSVTLGGAFRAGFSPRVQMRLTLDTTLLDAAVAPGTVWTYEGPYGPAPAQRLLDGAPLRPLPAIENDPLSHLSFGEGRERSFLAALSPTDPAAESILAVVSLRTDATVEVRLLRGGLPATGEAPPEGRKPLFGIFPLARQAGTCGF